MEELEKGVEEGNRLCIIWRTQTEGIVRVLFPGFHLSRAQRWEEIDIESFSEKVIEILQTWKSTRRHVTYPEGVKAYITSSSRRPRGSIKKGIMVRDGNLFSYSCVVNDLLKIAQKQKYR